MKLVIFGVGETAELAHFYFSEVAEVHVVAFAADPFFLPRSGTLAGLPTIPIDEAPQACPPSTHSAFVAVGARRLNRDRLQLCDRVEGLGYELASFVHPSATVASNVHIGKNCFIFEDNTLQPFTRIGDRCTLWSGNHLGHRSIVEDDVFITSHVVISGFCTVGRCSYLGVNATVGDNVRIAEDTVLGAGSLLLRDTEPGGVYIGSPARRLPGRRSQDAEL